VCVGVNRLGGRGAELSFCLVSCGPFFGRTCRVNNCCCCCCCYTRPPPLLTNWSTGLESPSAPHNPPPPTCEVERTVKHPHPPTYPSILVHCHHRLYGASNNKTSTTFPPLPAGPKHPPMVPAAAAATAVGLGASIHPSIHPSIYPSIHLAIHPSIDRLNV
jgi:hypothetical protein